MADKTIPCAQSGDETFERLGTRFDRMCTDYWNKLAQAESDNPEGRDDTRQGEVEDALDRLQPTLRAITCREAQTDAERDVKLRVLLHCLRCEERTLGEMIDEQSVFPGIMTSLICDLLRSLNIEPEYAN